MPGSVFCVMLAGHWSCGEEAPVFTVTVKEQVDEFPAASVAVAVTVVTPDGNTVPEAGVLLTTTPGQLSVAVTE